MNIDRVIPSTWSRAERGIPQQFYLVKDYFANMFSDDTAVIIAKKDDTNILVKDELVQTLPLRNYRFQKNYFKLNLQKTNLIKDNELDIQYKDSHIIAAIHHNFFGAELALRFKLEGTGKYIQKSNYLQLFSH